MYPVVWSEGKPALLDGTLTFLSNWVTLKYLIKYIFKYVTVACFILCHQLPFYVLGESRY